MRPSLNIRNPLVRSLKILKIGNLKKVVYLISFALVFTLCFLIYVFSLRINDYNDVKINSLKWFLLMNHELIRTVPIVEPFGNTTYDWQGSGHTPHGITERRVTYQNKVHIAEVLKVYKQHYNQLSYQVLQGNKGSCGGYKHPVSENFITMG